MRKKRILIGTDGSEFSRFAVEKACEFMKPHETEVICLSAYENPVPVAMDPTFFSGEYYETLLNGVVEATEASVNEAEMQIRYHFSAEEVPVIKEALNGFADEIIVDKAKEWNADLIVVGSHGKGFWGRLMGSVSTGVVHHAPCSVLVVRKPE